MAKAAYDFYSLHVGSTCALLLANKSKLTTCLSLPNTISEQAKNVVQNAPTSADVSNTHHINVPHRRATKMKLPWKGALSILLSAYMHTHSAYAAYYPRQYLYKIILVSLYFICKWPYSMCSINSDSHDWFIREITLACSCKGRTSWPCTATKRHEYLWALCFFFRSIYILTRKFHACAVWSQIRAVSEAFRHFPDLSWSTRIICAPILWRSVEAAQQEATVGPMVSRWWRRSADRLSLFIENLGRRMTELGMVN